MKLAYLEIKYVLLKAGIFHWLTAEDIVLFKESECSSQAICLLFRKRTSKIESRPKLDGNSRRI